MKGKNILTDLQKHEAMTSVLCGAERYLESAEEGTQTTFKSFENDIIGAMGEQALAKALDVYFKPTVNTFKKADLSERIQVRTTRYKGGRLAFRKGDDEDHVYILVINDYPRFRLVGWLWGHETKNKDFFVPAKGRYPDAYMVPQKHLNPFPLPQEIRDEL